MNDESERQEILQRLDYLSNFPNEVTYDVREGCSGSYAQWTNAYLLQKELWAINMLDRMDVLDQKLDTIHERQRRLIEFVKCYDGWVNGAVTLEQLRKARRLI